VRDQVSYPYKTTGKIKHVKIKICETKFFSSGIVGLELGAFP
jgi:hypothetical protein